MDNRVAYHGAVYILADLHLTMKAESLRTAYHRFILTTQPLPDRFTSLLEEMRPRALAIIAYLIAMPKKLDHIWSVCRIPEREVRSIQDLLPNEWHCALRWPLGMVGSIFTADAAV